MFLCSEGQTEDTEAQIIFLALYNRRFDFLSTSPRSIIIIIRRFFTLFVEKDYYCDLILSIVVGFTGEVYRQTDLAKIRSFAFRRLLLLLAII